MLFTRNAPSTKIPASSPPTAIGVTTGRMCRSRKAIRPRCRRPDANAPTAQIAASPMV